MQGKEKGGYIQSKLSQRVSKELEPVLCETVVGSSSTVYLQLHCVIKHAFQHAGVLAKQAMQQPGTIRDVFSKFFEVRKKHEDAIASPVASTSKSYQSPVSNLAASGQTAPCW
jgi:hypothetical protein